MDSRLAAYISQLPGSSGPRAADALAATVPPSSPFGAQLRSVGLVRHFSVLVGAHVTEAGLMLASWAFIGSAAFSGRIDKGRLAGWALCLAGMMTLQVLSRWLEGVVAIGAGGLLRQRLLAGAMAIETDHVRRQGHGELLGQAFEIEAIDRLGISGGLDTVLAALELILAGVVLAWAAPRFELAVLVAASCVAVLSAVLTIRRRSRWTTLRIGLTRQLVEGMIAHRTRVTQQEPEERHREEDAELERYAEGSAALDRSTACLETALPGVYVVAALAALAPSFLSGGAIVPLAVTLGAILFARDAFQRLTRGFAAGTAAWVGWEKAKSIFSAAAALPAVERDVDGRDTAPDPGHVLRVEDVFFTYEGRVHPAVAGCSLSLERGDFVLLEGESGSGKSTFASLVAGMRRPAAGVVLAGGLDLPTLGERPWRRRIAVSPQYHENHIFSASLGFNLLLGRPAPHSLTDIAQARELCVELGLANLLDRMPAGLDQMVGETGWQLSQGERTRVFLARALLQRSDVVVVDESLAALDPETLQQCLECVFRRAGTLLMVAHP